MATMTRDKNTIKLVTPHKGGQAAVYLHPSRFQVVACGRRFGKTEVGRTIVAREMLKNAGEVFWVSPTNKMSTPIWRMFLDTFGGIAKWVSAQERTIILPNNGKLVVWSGDSSGDTMRGQAPSLVIMDEAAMLPGELWDAVIRPSLMDKQGRAYFLSTPRGRNWFFDLFQMGDIKNPYRHPDYKSWCFPSVNNPHIPNLVEEIAQAKLTTTERYFRQEYLAEFLLDAGEVFKGVAEVSFGAYYSPYDGNFVMAIDFGRKNDYTVITVIDVDTHTQVAMERFNKISWKDQRQLIVEMYSKWKPNQVFGEENSIGDVIIEDLNNDGIPIEAFYTTQKSKRQIIEQLALDIEKKNITLLNERVQVNELQSFQSKVTQFGNIQYSAPSNGHDDTVMALAIANYLVASYNHTFGAAIPMIA